MAAPFVKTACVKPGFDPDSPVVQHWMGLAAVLMTFPRHLSQHTGGFVIARDSLSRLVPIENAAMVDRSVIQWDKDDLDALGLLKIDVLALGMLSAIRRALDLIGSRRRGIFRIQDVPAEDPETYEMICRADTVGRVPDRVARADEHAPPPAAAPVLRPGDRVAIVRRAQSRAAWCTPTCVAAGPGGSGVSARGNQARAGAHVRRADLPGAGDAGGHHGSRLHAR
jgi:hypothetical protein